MTAASFAWHTVPVSPSETLISNAVAVDISPDTATTDFTAEAIKTISCHIDANASAESTIALEVEPAPRDNKDPADSDSDLFEDFSQEALLNLAISIADDMDHGTVTCSAEDILTIDFLRDTLYTTAVVFGSPKSTPLISQETQELFGSQKTTAAKVTDTFHIISADSDSAPPVAIFTEEKSPAEIFESQNDKSADSKNEVTAEESFLAEMLRTHVPQLTDTEITEFLTDLIDPNTDSEEEHHCNDTEDDTTTAGMEAGTSGHGASAGENARISTGPCRPGI